MMKNNRLARGAPILQNALPINQIIRGTPKGPKVIKSMFKTVAGNLEAQNNTQLNKMFPRQIKKIGTTGHSAERLPYRKPETAKDPEINV